MLKQGDKAPHFKGLNQDGKQISLQDYAGKKLVLYFYPKDSTPGCTAQGCSLNESYESLMNQGYAVLGVSPDSPDKHKKFIDKHGFRFDLLADTDTSVIQLYGVWAEKKLYGKAYMGVMRTTFIIGEDGTILKIINKVKTSDHANQIMGEMSDID
jgi:thioredoxin-dependent peroxiredoxin